MKKIAIFLFEGAELFEIASFTDVFGWNNVVGLKEFRDIKVETISYKESIKCTWGGELRAEKIITEDNVEDFFDYDVLIIPGGFGKANFFKDKNNKIFRKINTKNLYKWGKILTHTHIIYNRIKYLKK